MDALNRDTLELRRSVNDPLFLDPPWLRIEPGSGNATLLATVPRKYLKLTGDVLSELSQAEKDAVDAAALAAARDAVADALEQQEDILRAFMLIVIDEFNLLRAPVYGGLYSDNVEPVQVIANNTVSALNALTGASAMSANGMTVDTVAGRLVLPDAGDYMVAWQLSFSGTANTTFNVAAYGGAATEVDGTRATRKLSAGGDVGSVSAGGMVTTPQANVPVNLRVAHSEGNDRDITVHAVQLYAYQMPSAMQRTEQQLRTAIRNRLGS